MYKNKEIIENGARGLIAWTHKCFNFLYCEFEY